MERKCIDCGELIVGRIDKKFCSDECRNNYNNNQKRNINNHMKNVNNILKRNRRLLAELNPDGKVKVHKNKLINKGFNFNYYTNIYTTQKGTIYYFCYEQGYLPIDNNYYALVHRQDYVE